MNFPMEGPGSGFGNGFQKFDFRELIFLKLFFKKLHQFYTISTQRQYYKKAWR